MSEGGFPATGPPGKPPGVIQFYILLKRLSSSSINEKGVLKSPTIILDLFISLFSSDSFWFVYFGTLLLGTYNFRIVCLLGKLTLLQYVRSLFGNFLCSKVYFVRDFPGGPEVKTPCSQCREHGFDPWSGN